MKKTLAILVLLLLLVFGLFARTDTYELSLSPNSIEYIDFPNAHEIEGAYASTSSKSGFGFGADWYQREGVCIAGWGVDIDMFLLPTYFLAGKNLFDIRYLTLESKNHTTVCVYKMSTSRKTIFRHFYQKY